MCHWLYCQWRGLQWVKSTGCALLLSYLGQGSQCSATLEFGFRGGVGSLQQARLAGTGMWRHCRGDQGKQETRNEFHGASNCFFPKMPPCSWPRQLQSLQLRHLFLWYVMVEMTSCRANVTSYLLTYECRQNMKDTQVLASQSGSIYCRQGQKYSRSPDYRTEIAPPPTLHFINLPHSFVRGLMISSAIPNIIEQLSDRPGSACSNGLLSFTKRLWSNQMVPLKWLPKRPWWSTGQVVVAVGLWSFLAHLFPLEVLRSWLQSQYEQPTWDAGWHNCMGVWMFADLASCGYVTISYKSFEHLLTKIWFLTLVCIMSLVFLLIGIC